MLQVVPLIVDFPEQADPRYLDLDWYREHVRSWRTPTPEFPDGWTMAVTYRLYAFFRVSVS